MVARVQMAATLSVFFLALSVGTLADIVDCHRLLLVCQIGMCLVATVFALLVGSGW